MPAAIAYLNRSDDGAIRASSAAALMPPEKLQNPHVARKWRGLLGSSEYLTIDLETPQSIDTVALMGLNLTAGGTTRLRVSATDSTATGSLLYDSSAVVGAVNPAYGYFIGLLPAPVTGRYVRIDLTDDELSYIEAGRLFVGPRTQFTRNFAPGVRWDRVDLSRKTKGRGGQTFIDRGNSYRTLDVTFEALTRGERYGVVEDIDRLAGERSDVLFLSDPTSDNLGADSIWGLLNGMRPTVQPYRVDIYSKSYGLEERL